MSLFHSSKKGSPDHGRGITIHPIDLPVGDDAHLQIPSVIIVPQLPQRSSNASGVAASSMRERYQEMSNVGGGDAGATAKPWRTDLARKSLSKRRFQRPSRVRRCTAPVAAEEANSTPSLCYSPDTSCNTSSEASRALDGSWSKIMDDGYPSDEEQGFCGSNSQRPSVGSDGSPNFLANYGFRGYGRYISTSFQRA